MFPQLLVNVHISMQTHTDRSACSYTSTYRSHIGLLQIGLPAPTLVLAFLLYVSLAAHIGHISVHIGLLQIGLPAPTLVLALHLYVSSAATICVSAY